MHRLLAVCFLVLALCLPAHAKKGKPDAPAKAPTREAGPPASFHGIPWGTPLAEVKDMEVRERNGPSSYAKVRDVPPRIADIDVADVVYAFCQDRFAGAMATYQGQATHEAILGLLSARYGQPVRPGEAAGSVAWPLGEVLILLEYDAPVGMGSLSYLHAPTYSPCVAAAVQTPVPDGAAGAAPPQDAPKAP